MQRITVDEGIKMEQFLPVPHCPSGKVTLCAVGEDFPQVCEQLQRYQINIFPIFKNHKLSKPVSSHPDLQLGILTGDQIVIGKGESSLRERLEHLGFQVVESQISLSDRYPQEAAMDFLSFGTMILGKQSLLREIGLLNNSQIIAVKQGYTKCNVAMINRHALITSDPGIAAACKVNDYDVLQIRPGYIELPGYETGFIGGCCGLIAADLLAVYGDLRTHPDYEQIASFLSKHHVSVLKLKNGTLKDIGGIIPLKQN